MNCKACQRRLLSTEAPERPAREVEAHLAACEACREWQRRLIQIEDNVGRLPVPPAPGPGKLLARLGRATQPATADTRTHAVTDTMPHRLPPAAPARPAARAWNGRVLAGGAVAAAVLIGCGAWLGNALWQAVDAPEKAQQAAGPDRRGKLPPAPRSLIAKLIQCDIRLARAGSPRERAEAVADLADSLQGETQVLVRATSGAELAKLAQLYGQVVEEAVVPRCRALPARDRRHILPPIVARLGRVEADAEQLARSRPASATSLRRIAAAARAGRTQLCVLMENDT